MASPPAPTLLTRLDALVARLTAPQPQESLPATLAEADALLAALREVLAGDEAEAEALLRGAAGGCCAALAHWAALPRPPPGQGQPQGRQELQAAAGLCWCAAAAASVAAALLSGLRQPGVQERLGSGVTYRVAAAGAAIFGPAFDAAAALCSASEGLLLAAQRQALGRMLLAALEVALGAAEQAVDFRSSLKDAASILAALDRTVLKRQALTCCFEQATAVLCAVDSWTSGDVIGSWRVWQYLGKLFICLKGQRSVLDNQMVQRIKLLAAQRHHALLKALVSQPAALHGWWVSRWLHAVLGLIFLAQQPHSSAGLGDATAGEVAAVLLRVLPAMHAEASSSVEECVGTCENALAFHWFQMTEGALAQPLTAAQLTSCLEAVALCTSADLALLDARLARPSRPAQLPDAGVIIAEPMSRAFGLSIQRKVWRSAAGPQREQLLAAALAAGEAVTRLVGRLVQEEEGQLEAASEATLGCRLWAADAAAMIASYVIPSEARPLLRAAASSMAVSASKLVLAVLRASLSGQTRLSKAFCADAKTPVLRLLHLSFSVASVMGASRPPASLLDTETQSCMRQWTATALSVVHAAQALAHAAIAGDSHGSLREAWEGMRYAISIAGHLITAERSGAPALFDCAGGHQLVAASCAAVLASGLQSQEDMTAAGASISAIAAEITKMPRAAVALANCGFLARFVEWVCQQTQGAAAQQTQQLLLFLGNARELLVGACHAVRQLTASAGSRPDPAWEACMGRFERLPRKQLRNRQAWQAFKQEALPQVLAWAGAVAAARQSVVERAQPQVQQLLAGALQLRACANLGCTNLRGCSEARLRGRRCGGCGLVRYCSRECAVAAWPEHARVCGGGAPGAGE